VLVVYRLKRKKHKAKIKMGFCENKKGDRKFRALKVLRLCPLVLLVRDAE